jgi:hypothetical protein
MKPILWLIASPVLLVLGVVCLFHTVNGSTNLSAGSSLSAFSFEINAKATGGWVIVAILVELAAVVAFLVGLISAARHRVQVSSRPAPAPIRRDM